MNANDAALYLGIARKTLYKWKRQAAANQGHLIFNGTAVRFRYRQTGVVGQGRISFEKSWLDEVKSAMEGRVTKPQRSNRQKLSNISVVLGTPPA